MLLIDFYKAVHAEMLPKNITKSVSYFTPRMSRVNKWDSVVMFGLQGFIKTYLIDYFNNEFFSKPFDEVIDEIRENYDLFNQLMCGKISKEDKERLGALSGLDFISHLKVRKECAYLPWKILMKEIEKRG